MGSSPPGGYFQPAGRLGLSVLPVTMHDVAALWVNDVSEGGAVDAWNKPGAKIVHEFWNF